MQQKTSLTLSENKRDYPTNLSSIQLSCDEVFSISQYYAEKNIRMYVQTYLGDLIVETSNALEDMQRIQSTLKAGEYVGYLFTDRRHGSANVHVECFVISNSQIIKPVLWSSTNVGLDLSGKDGCSSTDVSIGVFDFYPQADTRTCASLSLVYLKQLLKDDAKQMRELTLSFPYLLPETGLSYFFIPSPQVLRYSQSTKYNQYLWAMVMEAKEGTFMYKGEVVRFTTIQAQLELTLAHAISEGLLSLAAEATALLEQLPAFRIVWEEAYLKMKQEREWMDRAGQNATLAYTSRRLKTKAMRRQQQRINPGLALLQALASKKQEESLSDAELLAFFSTECAELYVYSSAVVGYFLSQLCKIVDCTLAYPWFFQNEQHYFSINHPDKFMDCSFFLDPKERHELHRYMRSRLHYHRMFDAFTEEEKSHPLKVVLSWAHAFKISTKPDMHLFMQEQQIDRDRAALMLLKSYVQWVRIYLVSYFDNHKILPEFLMEYIGEQKLISLLPELIQEPYFLNIEDMFPSPECFYAFVEQHCPIGQMLEYLQGNPQLTRLFDAYLRDCVDPKKQALLLFQALSEPSSNFIKGLEEGWVDLFAIFKYVSMCNTQQITLFLTEYRPIILKAMVKNKRPLHDRVSAIVQRLYFFPLIDQDLLREYQEALVQCDPKEQEVWLAELLQCTPLEERWEFLHQLCAHQDEAFLKKITSPREIKRLLPEINAVISQSLSITFLSPSQDTASETGHPNVALMERSVIKVI